MITDINSEDRLVQQTFADHLGDRLLFTDFVRPQFRQIRTLHAQNQKLRAARGRLLPRLMSGEIAA